MSHQQAGEDHIVIHRTNRPARATIKPIHLHEAEFLKPNNEEVFGSNEPRYLFVYGHMSKEKATELRDYLNEQLAPEKKNTGSVLVPIMGRMAG